MQRLLRVLSQALGGRLVFLRIQCGSQDYLYFSLKLEGTMCFVLVRQNRTSLCYPIFEVEKIPEIFQ